MLRNHHSRRGRHRHWRGHAVRRHHLLGKGRHPRAPGLVGGAHVAARRCRHVLSVDIHRRSDRVVASIGCAAAARRGSKFDAIPITGDLRPAAQAGARRPPQGRVPCPPYCCRSPMKQGKQGLRWPEGPKHREPLFRPLAALPPSLPIHSPNSLNIGAPTRHGGPQRGGGPLPAMAPRQWRLLSQGGLAAAVPGDGGAGRGRTRRHPAQRGHDPHSDPPGDVTSRV